MNELVNEAINNNKNRKMRKLARKKLTSISMVVPKYRCEDEMMPNCQTPSAITERRQISRHDVIWSPGEACLSSTHLRRARHGLGADVDRLDLQG
jgi:hypothetical protein